jgi:acyl-CoA synthetase (AMP-forming)/AMP-acid ligase II
MNISMLLDMAVDGMPDRIALGSRDGGLTFSDLRDRASRGASVIETADAERVVLIDVNSDVVPVLLFASALLEMPFVPVSYRLADDRLQSVATRTAPAYVVAEPSVPDRLGAIDGLQVTSSTDAWRATDAAESYAAGDLDGDAVAVWLFTSGTTGEPKAALLRHRHMTSYVLSTVEFMSAGDDEATLISVPPYHVAGMAAIVSNVYAGRRLVYLPQFDPKEWVRLAEAEAITHAMVVPTMLGRILDVLDEQGASLPALRHLSYGGGRMPVPGIERALDRLPHVGFVNAYGLTETSSTVSVLGPDDHRAAHGSERSDVRARLGSVGRALPTVELEIRDPLGAVVEPGVTGEIYVRGEQVAGEYQGASALTDDGWFPTRDSGRLDELGFLFVEGRLDDVIVRGGENLSPGEIEDVLVQHPAVADAAVIGVPDDEWGEAVAAAVVLEPGADATTSELQSWVRDRMRSSHAPVLVDVRAALPYTETGKLLRRVVKDELRVLASGVERTDRG